MTEQNAKRILCKAHDLGIDFFDTADSYSQGKSEEILGESFSGNRSTIVIASKVGMKSGFPSASPLSKKNILHRLAKSLESLKTDYLDIYYMHRFDERTPLKETLSCLGEQIREGRIRHLACSNFSIAQMIEARSICDRLDLENMDIVQAPYNLLQRGIETEVIPYCKREQMYILAYSPLRGGFLSGKYRDDEPPRDGTRAFHDDRYWSEVNDDRNFAIVDKVRQFANSTGTNMTELAFGWVLSNPSISVAVAGASNEEQLINLCNAERDPLSENECNDLNRISNE